METVEVTNGIFVETLRCSDFSWVCKVVSYTKYSCFRFLWDSRVTDQHYMQKVWPEMGQLIPGMHNVIHEVLVPGCHPFTLNWDY